MKPKYPTRHHGKHFIAHHKGYDIYQDITGGAGVDLLFWAFGTRGSWWAFTKRTAKLDMWTSFDCNAAAVAVRDFLFNDPSISPNSK